MNTVITDIKREFIFSLRQRSVQVMLLFALGLSVFSNTTGLLEINKQHETIERLLQFDEIDRDHLLEEYDDYGYIGYYTRHLTYSSPSDLAFAAIGQRDVVPWKHRVRILALEGQIYESDADNPELAYVGRIDFTFLISVLAPLIIILLLHDIRAAERASGRYDLLITTSQNPRRLWLTRAFVNGVSIATALLLPFIIGALISGSAASSIASVIAICVLQISFWTLLCYWIGKTPASAPQLASILLGIWLCTTIIIPVAGEKLINHMVEGPKGGDIVMKQRDEVNTGRDLAYDISLDAFVESHPEWRGRIDIDQNDGFSWAWYYAVHQLADERTAPISLAYRDATLQKYQLAGVVAWLSPAMLVQRSMTRLAQTDTLAALRYEQAIRDFHHELRHFYYPGLFLKQTPTREAFATRPNFTPLAKQ